MNKSVKKYLRRVRGWLPCTRRMKNRIMAQIEENVGIWAQDNPDCTYSQIEARFGKPEKIAAVYVENVGAEELLGNLHIKKGIVTAVTVTLVTVVLIWAVGVTVIVVDAMLNTHYGYIVTEYNEYEIGE